MDDIQLLLQHLKQIFVVNVLVWRRFPMRTFPDALPVSFSLPCFLDCRHLQLIQLPCPVVADHHHLLRCWFQNLQDRLLPHFLTREAPVVLVLSPFPCLGTCKLNHLRRWVYVAQSLLPALVVLAS